MSILRHGTTMCKNSLTLLFPFRCKYTHDLIQKTIFPFLLQLSKRMHIQVSKYWVYVRLSVVFRMQHPCVL